MAPKTDPAPVTLPPATPTDCQAVKQENWNVQIAYAVCVAESSDRLHPTGYAGQNNAGLNKDGTVDYGLMQINSTHADMVGGNLDALYDPATNIKVAYSLSHGGSDWTPWSTYNNGKYKQYLQ